MKIRSAEFVKSAKQPESFPDQDLPEFAFAGRSNVGKSSLINTLVQRRKLVQVSSTPGRTQLINFFNVNDAISFVDLPGYGWAKVSKKERRAWLPMIETYLTERKQLLGVVCIMDLRRGPEEDDLQLVHAAPVFGFQPILVFTKADKYGKNARFQRSVEVAKELGVPREELLLFSSTTGLGREELWRRICEMASVEYDG